MTDSFYDIAVSSADGNKMQVAQIDAFTEKAPIIKALPLRPCNKPMQNVYSKITSATGADYTDLDGVLPEMVVTSDLVSVDLSPFGGKILVGEDMAKKFGGKEAYFADKLPVAMRESAQAMEQSIIYNNFRQFALDEGKCISAGGSSNANYSMIMVNFTDGDNTGLYDPNGFGRGTVFDNMALGNGGLIDIGSGVYGYGMRSKLYTGIQLSNAKYISGIVNIDESNLPTALEISKMIDDADGAGFIYLHPRLKAILGATFKSQFRTINVDAGSGINTMVDSWDEVPFLTSRNFLRGTETNVSI